MLFACMAAFKSGFTLIGFVALNHQSDQHYLTAQACGAGFEGWDAEFKQRHNWLSCLHIKTQ